MSTETRDVREQLKDVRNAIQEQIEKRAVVRREIQTQKQAFAGKNIPPAQMSKSPEFKKSVELTKTLSALDDEIENLQTTENGLLQMIGGSQSSPGRTTARHGNGPESGALGADAWSQAARHLDLRAEVRFFEADGESFLRPMAAVDLSPSSGLEAPSLQGPFVEAGRDRRSLYRVLPRQQLDPGTMSIDDFRQTGSRTVTGEVERDPMDTSQKAELDLSIELATDPVRTFAVVTSGVPTRLFDLEAQFAQFLRTEMQFQLELALDVHTIEQIMAASPPFGTTGADLIAQVRNAIAEMRAVGASPSILAISPEDAAGLDLTQTSGPEAAYVFTTRQSGGASPLWSLQVVEVPNLMEPVLLDPEMLGLLYTASGRLLVDPFSAMDTNEVRLRLEFDGLTHVRNISGAFVAGEITSS
jgi:hypothetical protein